MDLYEKIVSGEEKLSLVGLGYVGMPIAVAFARKIKVVGFDLNEKKIELYKNGIDPTNEGFYGRSFKAAGSEISYCGSSDPGKR